MTGNSSYLSYVPKLILEKKNWEEMLKVHYYWWAMSWNYFCSCLLIFSVHSAFSRDISTISHYDNFIKIKRNCYYKRDQPIVYCGGSGSVPAAGCISRDPTSRPTCFTFHCCLFRSTLVSRKKCIEFSIGNTS